MKKSRRAPQSPVAARDEMPTLSQDELAALKAQDARRRQPRFSLELTAALAQRFVAQNVSAATEGAVFAAAARRAIMLLEACQQELLRDADDHTWKEITTLNRAGGLEWRRHLESQCRNGVASFEKGLLLITGQPSLTLALPLFKRWRGSCEAGGDAYEYIERDLGPEAEAAILLEVERYRGTGFDLNTLEQFERAFRSWYEEVDKPSARAKAGRVGGKKSRRTTS